MRRKVALYIADRLADLDDDSFILFNYTFEDLSNPTIVRNSYSQQITLKGTPRNNAIFGYSSRLDRKVGNGGSLVGADFNPSVKTPFVLYNEMNEVLESGYIKLDSIKRKGDDVEYVITLYGGLGSFLYSLSYDDEGNKMTLADLDYLGTSNTDTELDFTINRKTVLDAWAAMITTKREGTIWGVINFAPCYNGIPDGNFSPNKALVYPYQAGLTKSITEDGVTYTTDADSGYTLITLAESQDEWAVKDLRSYLQRPIFSMKAFWKAIAKPENNGGYTVDKGILETDTLFPFNGLWMTLPMLPSLGTTKQTTGDLSLSVTSSFGTSEEIARVDVVGAYPSGSKLTANINLNMQLQMPDGASEETTLLNSAARSAGYDLYIKSSVIFLQAVAYDANDSIVGGSAVKCLMSNLSPMTAEGVANACGYTPRWSGEGYESKVPASWAQVSGSLFQLPDVMSFTVTASNAAYYKIVATYYLASKINTATPSSGISYTVSFSKELRPTLFVTYDDYYTATSHKMIAAEQGSSVSYTSGESLRSGATITKALLLSTSKTPADYLLSFCKIFGLHILCDNATKTVRIVSRQELFDDETIDLTKRVDVSKDINITPFAFSSKWYDFELDDVGGAFIDEYKKTYGIGYGTQRVNTGYDFNSEATSLLESNAFRNAATVLARSKYFNAIFNGSTFCPSPFLDSGNKQTLWSSDGKSKELDISKPLSTATVTYLNDIHLGYDVEFANKCEFRDADNKPISGEDVLVIFTGSVAYPYFKVTDDDDAMDRLNGGVPCWMLQAGSASGVTMPIFSRYEFSDDNWHLTRGLDFGVPKELDIPGVVYEAGQTLYSICWKNYLADRYDVNTKVMTCYVDFEGMKVNEEILRKFYYYGANIWVLNAIRNYSLTTYHTSECEFVQVQDKQNYLK